MDLTSLPFDAALAAVSLAAGWTLRHLWTTKRPSMPSLPRIGAEHEHDWTHAATEWNAGKEVHIMVCWHHDTPVIERRERP